MSKGEPAESAVVVVVPELEPVVGAHRARLDWSAAWGVPAHVTVLYPFVPPDRVDATVVERLADAVAGTGAFDAGFTRTCWFGEDVVWVAPEPADRFRALTEAVAAAFPEHPPYEGRFADVVPHLTVGDQGTVAERRAAEEEVRRGLPVHGRVAELHVMVGAAAPGSWRTVATVPLG
jgi:2'-5' RNA ligase